MWCWLWWPKSPYFKIIYAQIQAGMLITSPQVEEFHSGMLQSCNYHRIILDSLMAIAAAYYVGAVDPTSRDNLTLDISFP